ncbi:MAG: ATP-binding protein [Planctomycetes bacterium]|nr:ATP-binding protein [Planctomycetota bacterium]
MEMEIDWFHKVIDTRIRLYFEQGCKEKSIYDISAPRKGKNDSFYWQIVKEHRMSFDERIIVMLALVPHIRPQLLDTFLIRNKNLDRPFTEFGGWKGNSHGGFLPTAETAAFIIAGNDLQKRLDVMKFFDDDHFFSKDNILKLENHGRNEPFLSNAIVVLPEFLSRITSGSCQKPDYNIDFPAKLIVTKQSWDDLVLAPEVIEEIDHIIGWARHSNTIMEKWGFERVIKPGYRALFYGPPGTGKTLTANLIGLATGSDVYRIDLSMVVSKYIGETEKNLANVFDQAENKNWILFFDEADALFGKRTQTSSSHDRYANQEVSYLLQRTEEFPGVVILATNLKANIDDAFARRFQSVIYFPMPDPEQRLLLWENMFNGKCKVSKGLNIKKIAEDHELSGGAITNVVRYGAISALRNKRKKIIESDLIMGITRELMKEGKTMNY